ncbi:MAG: hypothetical protein AB7I30_03575 [Isosphaeraceae bacterium]
MDIFKILRLPGVADVGVLVGYGSFREERGASPTVDPPPDEKSPFNGV